MFLDRDGVINEVIVRKNKPFAPTHLADFRLLPLVFDALQNLRNAGFLNIVVTNQPDLATGKQTWAGLNVIHKELLKMLAIDLIKVCPHLDEHRCECRKPAPGMLLDAASELDIDISESYMIGDRWSDIAAGQSAGCKETFYVNYGYAEQSPGGVFLTVPSLKAATEIILTSSHTVEAKD